SAVLLGATAGAVGAGVLYDRDGGWQLACAVAAGVLLAASVLMRIALRAVGVTDRPAPPTQPRPEPEPEPEPAGGAARAARPGAGSSPLRAWAVHAAVYVGAQIVLGVAGYSWPVETVLGGPHGAEWYWNASGHWLVNADRIWTLVFLIDTVWSFGRAVWTRRRR